MGKLFETLVNFAILGALVPYKSETKEIGENQKETTIESLTYKMTVKDQVDETNTPTGKKDISFVIPADGIKKLKSKAEEFLLKGKDIANTCKEKADILKEKALEQKEKANDKLQDVLDKSAVKVEETKAKVEESVQSIKEKTTEIKDKIQDTTEIIKEKVENAKKKAKSTKKEEPLVEEGD